MACDNLRKFPGTMLGRNHRVEAVLGEGSFGLVTKCLNVKTGKLVAVKVFKDSPSAAQDAQLEIYMLGMLRCLDPDTCNIVRCHGFFTVETLTCLVFDLLDLSLYSYMRERHNRGLPMSELRPIMHQLATALKHLSSIGIVHADLKPDNIMVVDRRQQPLQVRVIDFGLAHPVSAAETGNILQTQWYRAPEIMLSIPYTEAIDMWSLGLVAAEMAIGYPLYPGRTDYDVLRFIIKTQGQPADYVLDRAERTRYFFNYLFDNKYNNDWRWTFKTPEDFAYDTGYYARDTRCAKLTSLDDLLWLMSRGQRRDQDMFLDLIKRMLQLDADQRIKPLEVLQHPFFGPSSPQSDHQISQDSVKRKTVSPAVHVVDTEEVDIDVCMDTNIKMADADHQQPPCCLRGPEISQDSVERKTVSPTVEAEDTDFEDVHVQNAGCFGHFFRRIRKAFRKLLSRMSS